jgi:predicted amidophosphoribosyltransferase
LQAVLRPALQAIYPPQCLTCDAQVTTDFGLCGPCWRDTAFISSLVCDSCGTPLPGDDPGHRVLCDDCLIIARPWDRGRAALLYKGNGRKLVLALKHADRTDLARPAADWMARTAAPLLAPGMVVAPVPLHWLRLFTRRYNQAALLSAAIARVADLQHIPDLLLRKRNTRSQEGRDRDGRFRNVEGALRLHPRHAAAIAGRPVLLVDDVMTSGATLAAAADACRAVGAGPISVVVLARVAKDT